MQPVKAGCRRRPGTPASSPAPHPPSPALPPLPLLPQSKHFCLSCLWGKSLPAELDRSPAARPPPRQHPSLTRSLPLLALPLTLTPSAGGRDFTGMGSWRSLGAGEGDTLSPQRGKAWVGGWTSRDSGEQESQGIWTSKESGTGELEIGVSKRKGDMF